MLDVNCGVTVSHKSEGHEHATHGHKVTSSEHGEKKEEEEKERKTGITPKLCVVVESVQIYILCRCAADQN